MRHHLRIGELAKAALCSVETVRYYEREGLLPPPPRSAGNYRVYDAGHVARLLFIRNCRSLGMSHADIRKLIVLRDAPGKRCDEVNALLDDRIVDITQRIRQLESLKRELANLRNQCCDAEPSRNCAVMQSLARASRSAARV